ncbi:hypothetical protein ACOCJ4_05785 [Knoellia sp. CPCC 206435]|uniref:hypothetical protein n=1 Tax=Knoellia terrae TaxID=3404797 RepID=UPI003B4314DC
MERIDDSCLLLFDRASAEHSGPAITSTIKGLCESVEYFATTFGINAMPAIDAIGGRSELTRRLQHESVLHLSDDLNRTGRSIKTWTLVVTDLLPQGILIALQTGSGTKIDAAYHQPAAYWLAMSVLAEYRPGVLFSREWPRSGRDGFAMGPVVYELRRMVDTGRVPAIGAVTGLRMQEFGDETEETLYRQGQAARLEAKWFGQRGALARQKTAPHMLHGRAPYAGNNPAPPGTATATVVPGAFDDGGPEQWPDVSLKPGEARYLYVDTPSYRPRPVLVRSTRSQVFLSDGSPAPDQAGLVVWFLAHLGTRDENGQVWDQVRCARHLADSGYSTEALRNLHRPDAVWTINYTSKATLRYSTRNLCRSILDHLDEYATGTFTLAMPGGHGETGTIRGVFPPSGFWLAPGRPAEIRDYLAEVGNAPSGPAHVFAGLPVELNGGAASLEASARRGPPQYHFVQADGHRIRSRHAPIPPVQHDFLIQLLAQGFTANLALPRLAPPDSPVPELDATAREAHRQVAALEAVQEGRLDRLDLDDLQEHTTRAALSRRYHDGELELVRLRTVADLAQKALDVALAPNPTGVHHERLIDLLGALADPRSAVARDLMGEGLTLTAVHEVLQEPDHVPRHRVEVTVRLAIHDGHDTWELVSTGTYEGGPAAKVLPRLTAAVNDLRRGVGLQDSLGADWHRWLGQIRTALGPGGRTTRVHLIDDPRLQRLVMAVMHPTSPEIGADPHHPRLAGPAVSGAGLTALAKRLAEPPALIRQIAAVHGAPPPGHKWLQDAARVVGDAYVAVADTGRADLVQMGKRGAVHQLLRGRFGPEWQRVDQELVLARCAGCGGTARVALRLREAAGSVCLSCRTDRYGVLWPPDYDRYAHPHRRFP